MLMSQKNKDYWADRFEILQESLLNKGDTYVEDLDQIYKAATRNIEKEIINWYARFAQNNEISMAEARKWLTSNELKELRWDVNEYIKRGQENALTGEWIRELENASARVHISRLEALKLQIQQQVEVLYGNQLDSVDSILRGIYTEGYYHTAYEIAKGTGIGTSLSEIDTKKLDAVINKPWSPDGTNFSQKIWSNRTKLVNTLHNNLSQMIIRGESPDRTVKALSKVMDVNKSQAGRLVMTESAYFSSAAQRDCFTDLDVEKYEVLATLDSHTSEICRSLDGKVFDMKDYQAGVTAPPFHCWCRTTTVPYFNDEFTEGEQRAARDEDGKTEYVDAKMNYEDWHQQYVEADPKYLLKEKMERNSYSDQKQYEKYKEVLGKDVPESIDKFQELKYNDSEKWKNFKGDYRKLNYYNKVLKNEPAITADLKEIERKTDTSLVGLDYRLKTKESYLRKVNFDSNSSTDEKVIRETIENTNDIIRYTFQALHNNLTEKYFEINYYLTEKGYKQIKLKNTWLVKANPYKGINCNYVAPTEQKFEIQFHTPESFELKNGELHHLYEKWRVISNKASKEAIELSKKMEELSSKLKVPKDIEKVR